MARTQTTGSRIRSICSCVPSERFDNLKDTTGFSQDEVRKVTAMAGVSARRVADDLTCSSDLCEDAANRALDLAGWERDSVDALINTYQPQDGFRIYKNGSRLAALRRLIEYTGCAIRWGADGNLHVFTPTTSGIVFDYQYSFHFVCRTRPDGSP